MFETEERKGVMGGMPLGQFIKYLLNGAHFYEDIYIKKIWMKLAELVPLVPMPTLLGASRALGKKLAELVPKEYRDFLVHVEFESIKGYGEEQYKWVVLGCELPCFSLDEESYEHPITVGNYCEIWGITGGFEVVICIKAEVMGVTPQEKVRKLFWIAEVILILSLTLFSITGMCWIYYISREQGKMHVRKFNPPLKATWSPVVGRLVGIRRYKFLLDPCVHILRKYYDVKINQIVYDIQITIPKYADVISHQSDIAVVTNLGVAETQILNVMSAGRKWRISIITLLDNEISWVWIEKEQ